MSSYERHGSGAARLARDLRDALRLLTRQPAFAVLATITMALAIGR
jgi:hypothetical protein